MIRSPPADRPPLVSGWAASVGAGRVPYAALARGGAGVAAGVVVS